MQEEVTQGAVTLIVNGSKMTEQAFEKAVKKFLEEVQKSKQPKIYRGKQTLKQLAGQNAGLANIEISDQNIRAFTQVAKKPGVLQEPGRRRDHGGLPGVCQQADGPGGAPLHPGAAEGGQGAGGAEGGAPHH